jgi:hypothetical protein
MSEDDRRDFACAIFIEFAEGRLGTLSFDDFTLELKALQMNGGAYPFNGGYQPETDIVFIRPTLDFKKALKTLFHEVGHRIYGESETYAKNYAERRLEEWEAMSDEAKEEKIKENIQKIRVRAAAQ